jgi:superfamily II DNA/RNA helicase
VSSDDQTENQAEPTTEAAPVTFADLGLSPKVLSAVIDAGYTIPTPIQAGAIPHALQGKDILGIAQTGTGKTAAFVLPMITQLEKGRARARMPRTLILEPTRELAAQVEENFVKYGVNRLTSRKRSWSEALTCSSQRLAVCWTISNAASSF